MLSNSLVTLLRINRWRGWLLLLTVLLVVLTTTAQPSRRMQKWFTEARQHFSRQDYQLAIDQCEKILKRDSTFLDARLLLADIYHETKNTRNEIHQLEKAREKSELPLIIRRLGNAYFSIGKYGEALEHYKMYLDATPQDNEIEKEINRKIESSRFALNARENPVEFEPERLPDAVNSSFDEYWPSLSIDQQQLVVTRLIEKPGQLPREDFYISEYGPDGWEKARPVASINTADNEGAQSLSADGKLLFFTACNRPGGMGSCDIYYSVRQNGDWTTPVNAGSPLNTSSWEAQPSFSPDGRYLYFSSNRPGGKGQKDIWRAEFLGIGKNGRLKWNAPENLGDSINTPGNEISPFAHAGNKDFYFASDFHTGMGGLDLFMADIQNDSVFSQPQNLGYPINTSNDEQGLHVSADGQTAFFSSARDSLSGLDIYSFQLDESIQPHPATYVKATVSDAETNDPVKAQIELLNLEQPNDLPRIETTGTNGELLLCLPAGKNYSFSVSKNGYLFYSNTFDLTNSKQIHDPYELNIALIPVEVGAEMNLYNIYFETDSFRILPESEPELQKLVELLDNNPGLAVEVQGHTDNTGSAENNRQLSDKRARSVVNFLVSYGIKKERLQWKGYGEERPVADNDTSEGRRKNRRTTIKILEK